ncbi:ATP-binding protein [Nevskia sp.]|uniref:ATP-binding protein n=1 Tax=Nevskia sp. TaxID=1929292 RepID=UPI0025E1A9B0|nr:ATP-binding protein [Nevskia sp.]
MKSLRTRLLIVATFVLMIFMLLCGAGLDQAFRGSAVQAQRDKQQGLIFALLGAADADDRDQLTISKGALPDPRFGRVQSGLEALIFNASGKVIWRSPSFVGKVPELLAPEVGSTLFTDLGDRFAMTYGVRWVADSGGIRLFSGKPKPQRYTVAVLEDKIDYLAQLQTFRRILWTWLGGAAVALILVQVLVLSWGLAPLRKLVRELHGVEAAQQSRIEAGYPDELTPLAEGLNAMIAAERNQQTRYRNALDDLAHSLKTPLAVLRGLVEDETLQPDARERMRDPVDRMQEITNHQLRKAAAAGRRTLAEPVRLKPLADKISGALIKVYASKRPRIAIEAAETLKVRADEGDLYELLGNLLDNATKWCRGEVRFRAEYQSRSLRLIIDDDGPGFPEDAEKLLSRGVRADSITPGQGIGLGAVAELVKVYDGTIELGRAGDAPNGAPGLGGARVTVTLAV